MFLSGENVAPQAANSATTVADAGSGYVHVMFLTCLFLPRRRFGCTQNRCHSGSHIVLAPRCHTRPLMPTLERTCMCIWHFAGPWLIWSCDGEVESAPRRIYYFGDQVSKERHQLRSRMATYSRFYVPDIRMGPGRDVDLSFIHILKTGEVPSTL
jgi:hypothetical protein